MPPWLGLGLLQSEHKKIDLSGSQGSPGWRVGCTRSYGVHTALLPAVGVADASPWKPVSILVTVTVGTLESCVTTYWEADHIMTICQFITCFSISYLLPFVTRESIDLSTVISSTHSLCRGRPTTLRKSPLTSWTRVPPRPCIP